MLERKMNESNEIIKGTIKAKKQPTAGFSGKVVY